MNGNSEDPCEGNAHSIQIIPKIVTKTLVITKEERMRNNVIAVVKQKIKTTAVVIDFMAV